MKYVIFSDIHGNAETLELLLKVENVKDEKQYIFCGDIVGYYYESMKCVSLLKSLDNLIAVRGNHDQMYMDAFDDWDYTEMLVARYGASYRVKDLLVYEYIASLSLQRRIIVDGLEIKIQHGSPADLLNGRVYPDTSITFESEDSMVICGHTHYRMMKKKGSCIWLNPGSLGQPRDGKGFSYCVLDTLVKRVTFHRIENDSSHLIHQIEKYDPENNYLKEVLRR